MLLAIDTCGATGTIALGGWEGDAIRVIAQAELAGKTFAAELVPKIRALLEENSATVRGLEAVIVVNGPGSFTGVRIGVSAAKGLAEALEIPLIALSRLALLARKGETRAAALDAGRGEFYFGSYIDEAPFEKLVTAEQMRDRASEPIATCEPELANRWPGARLVPPPDAADALSAVAPRLRAKDYDDLAILDGNYVRRTAAELFARPAAGRM
jgi:tRNA threonylcarbamoyladenosine biosynthesis protein TsaB